MTILIDIGNTAIKWQLRGSEQVADTGRGDVSQLMVWLESLGNLPSQRVAVSCVRDDGLRASFAMPWFSWVFSVVFAEFSDTCRCLERLCKSFSLGVDRWLAVLALKSSYESGIVDVGTACTIDV